MGCMTRRRNYVYKGNIAYEYKTCPTCDEVKLIRRHKGVYCSNRCAKLGKWTSGDNVTYRGAHRRVDSARGKASSHKCVSCGADAYQWANLTGNYPDPNDYQPMCVPCHKRFDGQRRESA